MPTTRQGGGLHYAWVIAGVTFLALLAASGVRSSFGVFIKPLEQDFGGGGGVLRGRGDLSGRGGASYRTA